MHNLELKYLHSYQLFIKICPSINSFKNICRTSMEQYGRISEIFSREVQAKNRFIFIRIFKQCSGLCSSLERSLWRWFIVHTSFRIFFTICLYLSDTVDCQKTVNIQCVGISKKRCSSYLIDCSPNRLKN